MRSVFNSTEEFIQAFVELPRKKRLLLLENNKEHITSLIQSSDVFTEVLEHLSILDRPKAYELFRPFLDFWIKTPEDFSRITWNLGATQRLDLYEAFKKNLDTWINDGDDFSRVTQNLDQDIVSELYRLYKHKLLSSINTAGCLNNVCLRLLPEYRLELYEAYRSNFLSWIRNSQDFRAILEYCPEELIPDFYKDCEPYLSVWNKTAMDMAFVFRGFSPKIASELQEKFKLQLFSMIYDISDFGAILVYLSPQEREKLCAAYNPYISQWITSASDFSYVLEFIPSELHYLVNDACKERFSYWVDSALSFKVVIQNLSSQPELQSTLYNIRKDQFLDWFNECPWEFSTMLVYLTSNQVSEVFQSLSKKITDWILDEGAEFFLELAENYGEFKGQNYKNSLSVICEYLQNENAATFSEIMTQMKVARDFFGSPERGYYLKDHKIHNIIKIYDEMENFVAKKRQSNINSAGFFSDTHARNTVHEELTQPLLCQPATF